MVRFVRNNFVLSSLLILLVFCSFAFSGALVWTDKEDYAPGETVIIYGSGFEPNAEVLVKVIRPDGSVVSGDGSFRPWPQSYDYATVSENGEFEFYYILNGILGKYIVEIIDVETANVLATTSFTDAVNTTTTLNSISTPLSAGQTGVAFSGAVKVGASNIPNRTVELRYLSGTSCPSAGNRKSAGSVIATVITTIAGFSGTFTAPAAGTYQFWASHIGDSSYQDSVSNCQQIVVNPAAKQNQTITVTQNAPSSAVYNTSFNVTATASSGLPVAITTSGSCSGSGSGSAVITMTSGTGTCYVYYNQAGNDNYHPAPQITQTVNAQKANRTCTLVTDKEWTRTYDGTESNTSCIVSAGSNDGSMVFTRGSEIVSSPDSVTNAGVYNYSCQWTEGANYNGCQAQEKTLTINKALLSVKAEDKEFEYSDPVPKLTYTITGFVDGDTIDVVSGEASCTTTATQFSPSGTYQIKCTQGTLSATNYYFNFVDGTMTVKKEKVEVVYTGDTYVLTAGPTITTAVVTLSAQLIQEDDSYPGDLSLATVTFILKPVGGGSDIIVPKIPVNSSGVALTTKTVAVGTYDVVAVVSKDNLYWKTSKCGTGSLNVVLGSTEQRVTGGGWVPDSLSLNGKDNFGFTVNYNKTGAPKGSFLFIFRGTDGYDYKIKNNSWAKGGLSFTSTNSATFSGQCTLQKISQETGEVVESWGNYTFIVHVKDGDLTSPKTKDTIAITIFSPDKKIWKQLGTNTSQIALGGGNITVHSK
ncbi:MAG: hypothetical protein N3F05_04345 [Candidatus Diapherotrites archaeon]|nr:hypothetical protein [Candidatus Diapherotrites archaeon]